MSNKTILLVENAFSEQNYAEIKKLVTGKHFPWYSLAHTAYKRDDKNTVQDYSFSYDVYNRSNPEEDPIISDIFPGLYPALYPQIVSLFNYNNIKIKNLLRIRFGLITAHTDTYIHDSHIDYQYPHVTGLLYFTNCNGKTFFYEDDKKTIIYESTPKENNMIIFDGTIPHASSRQTDSAFRVAMNVNIIPE